MMASPKCVAEVMARADQGSKEDEVDDGRTTYGFPVRSLLMPASVSILLVD